MTADHYPEPDVDDVEPATEAPARRAHSAGLGVTAKFPAEGLHVTDESLGEALDEITTEQQLEDETGPEQAPEGSE